jgi:hypothetical protein
VDTSCRRQVDLRAGGLDDPDATRAATVLGAYFRAEQASTLRRRVWRGAAVGALLVWAVNIVTSALTPVDIVFASILAAAALVAVMVADLQARARLDALLTGTDRP